MHFSQRQRIIDIVVSGKGTIELLFDCLFFTRDEFKLSQLIKYRKTLFLTLKMRDLFQQIQDMTDYNPRIINSASK